MGVSSFSSFLFILHVQNFKDIKYGYDAHARWAQVLGAL